MNLGNALTAYEEMLKHFGQTCADTIDTDEDAADDTAVENN